MDDSGALRLCVPPPAWTRTRGVAHKGYLWPKQPGLAHWCNIGVRFLGGSEWQRMQVIETVTGYGGWNRASGAQFVFGDAGAAPVRVTFEPGASWSHPGTYGRNGPFDVPTLNLGWVTWEVSEKERRRVILHECGHALGLMHTHEQPGVPIPWNREAVYAWYRKYQGWGPDLVDSQVLTPMDAELAVTNAYGPSIMHYGIPAELLTDPAWAMARVMTLTAGDVELVQTLYGPPPVGTAPLWPPVEPETDVYLPVVRG